MNKPKFDPRWLLESCALCGQRYPTRVQRVGMSSDRRQYLCLCERRLPPISEVAQKSIREMTQTEIAELVKAVGAGLTDPLAQCGAAIGL